MSELTDDPARQSGPDKSYRRVIPRSAARCRRLVGGRDQPAQRLAANAENTPRLRSDPVGGSLPERSGPPRNFIERRLPLPPDRSVCKR